MKTARFTTLFGVSPSDIQRTCILTPFLSKNLLANLGVPELVKGKLCSTGQAKNFTIVKTLIGAPFAGDAVLYLKDTSCENIIFLGACGLLPDAISGSGLDIGSITAPVKAFNAESFSSMLTGTFFPQTFPADIGLLDSFLAMFPDIRPVNCISVGSIKMESKLVSSSLASLKAETADLECSAVYSAARHINRRAVALMYITDLVGKENKKEVFEDLSKDDQNKISNAQKRVADIILNFCRNTHGNS